MSTSAPQQQEGLCIYDQPADNGAVRNGDERDGGHLSSPRRARLCASDNRAGRPRRDLFNSLLGPLPLGQRMVLPEKDVGKVMFNPQSAGVKGPLRAVFRLGCGTTRCFSWTPMA